MRVLVLADLHVGSSVAPWPAKQPLADGGKWGVNRYQKWLNRCWSDMLVEVSHTQIDALVLLGDIIQGVNPRDGQLVTNRVGIQCAAAEMLLRPLAEQIPTRYYVRGTEWHEGKSSEHVEDLATRLGCKPHPRTESPTWRRLYLDIGGHVVDMMHHVGTTSIAQYSATGPLRDAYNHKLELVSKHGRQAPLLEMSVRAHRHTYVYVRKDGIQAVTCPCFQLGTAFSDARANVVLSDIGWLLIEGDKQGLGVRERIYPQSLPHVEVA